MAFALKSKAAQFYFLRFVLGLVCATCETLLCREISWTMNPRVAVLFLLVIGSSPGMFHASIAYLPSSFAMYTAMLGASAFMNWRGGLRTAQGIFWFGVGACLGWPFAVALSAPFLVEELCLALLSDSQGQYAFLWRLTDGVVRALAVLGIQTAIDASLYKKLTVVPLNIVTYNVFSSKGPDLYGTEPWHFYLRNLALNFHVWLPLALLAIPLLLLQTHAKAKAFAGLKVTFFRGFSLLSPFYLWLAIFSLQAHKEERFMYPAYPFLALNAAYALHLMLSFFGSDDPRSIISRIPVMLRLAGILSFLGLALSLSVFRILGTWNAFSAPLSVYKPLDSSHALPQANVVCLGKEWYRFPSHFLVPDTMRTKFIRSEFHGLLPGEFSEANGEHGLFPGTWLEPPGMNDENLEDVGKYTDLEHCDFLVDSSLPSTVSTGLEPDFVNGDEGWEKVKCVPYLDAASTGLLGRLGWIPDLPFVPARLRRVWGEYCLLRRIKRH